MIKSILVFIITGFILYLGMNYLNYKFPIDDDPRTSYSLIGDVEIGRFLILLFSTIIGLLFEIILKNVNNSESIKFKDIFNGKDLIISSMISPLIFLLIYGLIRKQPDDVMASLLSFQNAFFWKSILNTTKLGLENKNNET
jgi:hypothetical protein